MLIAVKVGVGADWPVVKGVAVKVATSAAVDVAQDVVPRSDFVSPVTVKFGKKSGSGLRGR